MDRLGRIEWELAGDTYYAVVDGRIVALLYWQRPDVGELLRPDGEREPIVMPTGWLWLSVDAPDRHVALAAPDLDDDDPNTRMVALVEATARTAAYLEGVRS